MSNGVVDIDASSQDSDTSARSIEDPQVIKQVLSHPKSKAVTQNSRSLPDSRAPPRLPMSPARAYQHSLASAPLPPLTPVLVSVSVVQSASLAWGSPATGVAVRVNELAKMLPVTW